MPRKLNEITLAWNAKQGRWDVLGWDKEGRDGRWVRFQEMREQPECQICKVSEPVRRRKAKAAKGSGKRK